jgi:cell volume regulation protein A
MQIVMFLVLGLLVFPSRLVPVAGAAILAALFLVLVARPVAVLAALSFARLRFRQKLLISWVGLRGAVPIVLATFPYLAGFPKADLYFNIVFFIVITSVLLQGTTLRFAATRLRLTVPVSGRRPSPLEYSPPGRTSSELIELTVADASPFAGRRIMDMRLPGSALVVLVSRGDDYIAPRGGTEIRAGDTMLVLVDRHDVEALRSSFPVQKE